MKHSSIAKLLGVIALIALAIAAIRDSSGACAEAVVGIAAGTFVVAIALVAFRSGKSLGWVMFAAAGGAYFLASWPFAARPRDLPYAGVAVEYVVQQIDGLANPPPLIRHPPSTRAEFFKLTEPEQRIYSIESNFDSERGRAYENSRPGRLDSSRRICHSCLSVAIGAVFAASALLIARGRAKKRESTSRVITCP